MKKVPTTLLVDPKIRDEAKKMNIPLGKTLENALKEQINKDTLIEDMKLERNEHLRAARELKHKIDRLEKRKREEIEALGEINVRMEKALDQLLGIFDRVGDVTDEQIQFASSQKHVPYLELKEEFTKKLAKMSHHQDEEDIEY